MAWMKWIGTIACLAGVSTAVACGNDDEKPKSTAFGGSGGSAANAGASGSAAQGGSSGSAASGGTGNSAGASGSASGGSGNSGGTSGGTAGIGGSGGSGAGTGGASDASTEFTPQDECQLCEQLGCAGPMTACDDNTECSAMVGCVEQGCEYSANGVGCIEICIEATCTSSASIQLYLDTLTCRFCNQACETECAGLCQNLSLTTGGYTCNG